MKHSNGKSPIHRPWLKNPHPTSMEIFRIQWFKFLDFPIYFPIDFSRFSKIFPYFSIFFRFFPRFSQIFPYFPRFSQIFFHIFPDFPIENVPISRRFRLRSRHVSFRWTPLGRWRFSSPRAQKIWCHLAAASNNVKHKGIPFERNLEICDLIWNYMVLIWYNQAGYIHQYPSIIPFLFHDHPYKTHIKSISHDGSMVLLYMLT